MVQDTPGHRHRLPMQATEAWPGRPFGKGAKAEGYFAWPATRQGLVVGRSTNPLTAPSKRDFTPLPPPPMPMSIQVGAISCTLLFYNYQNP